MNESQINPNESHDLAHLLLHPKKSSSAWQADAGRLTGLAHLKTLAPETSDLEYLAALALCKWAEACGVADAKKKSVQAVRFRTKEPPPLKDLPRREMVRHALILLSELRGEWCRSYATALVVDDQLDKDDIKVLGKWAARVSKNITGLLEILITPRLTNSSESKRTEAWLKLVEKLIDQLTWPSAQAAANDCGIALSQIAEFISAGACGKSLEKQFWTISQRICERAYKEHPFTLIETDLIMGISALAAKTSATEKIKDFKKYFSGFIGPTISCLAVLGDRGGRDGEAYCRALLPVLVSSYPDFGKQLADGATRSKVLAAVQKSSSEEGNASLEDAAVSIYARLLPSWYDFYSNYPEADKLSVMNANLLEAAAINCVEFMGEAGAVENFDPIAHRIKGDPPMSVQKVRLIRPAIIFKRGNGSYRVVLPAIVIAV
jgi:hypothetical protein